MHGFRELEPSHHLREGKNLGSPLSATAVRSLCLAAFAHSAFLFVLSASLTDGLCSLSLCPLSPSTSLRSCLTCPIPPPFSLGICLSTGFSPCLIAPVRLSWSLSLSHHLPVFLRFRVPEPLSGSMSSPVPAIYTCLPCTVCSQVPTQGPGLIRGVEGMGVGEGGEGWSSSRPLSGGFSASKLGVLSCSAVLILPQTGPEKSSSGDGAVSGSGGNSVQEDKSNWEDREHRPTNHPHTLKQKLSRLAARPMVH